MTDTAVPIQYRLTITAEVEARCSRVVGRYVALRPMRIVSASLRLAAFTVLGFGYSTDTGEPFMILVFVLVGVVFAVGWPALFFASTTRRVRQQFPVGEEWATGYSASTMRVESARSRSETAYSAFDRMIVRDRVVLLRRQKSRIVSVIPAELMPADTQRLVAARLAK